MQWRANIRLTLTPTYDDRIDVVRSVTQHGGTASSMEGSERLNFRRIVHIRHLVTEALGKQFVRWSSLLQERPWAEYRQRDDA